MQHSLYKLKISLRCGVAVLFSRELILSNLEVAKLPNSFSAASCVTYFGIFLYSKITLLYLMTLLLLLKIILLIIENRLSDFMWPKDLTYPYFLRKEKRQIEKILA